MRQYPWPRGWLRPLSLAVAATVWLAGASAPAQAEAEPTLTGWITENAQPLITNDPSAPLDDLTPLGGTIGDAAIVGLGESTHGASEEWRLKHRVLRLLVEELGFRSIAWEEDWTVGLQVNDYILTGEGDLDELMGKMATTWRSQEVRAVLAWLRDYNARHDDKVRFVGVEFFALGVQAFDAVEAYVAEFAPERLAELRRHLDPIRPETGDASQHLVWYLGVEDKKPYIRAARAVYELVKSLPETKAAGTGTTDGSGDRELALQHARQILSYYELHSIQDFSAWYQYRDERSAQNLRWWRQRTGDRIAWWAASPHTADAPDVRYTDLQADSAGSHLRRWYGDQYYSIGFTFGHGSVFAGFDQPPYVPQRVEVPPPAPEWAEAPLAEVALDQFALALRTDSDAPTAVREWLERPTATRLIGPAYDPDRPNDFTMSGGSLAQWFDAIVHSQQVTPWQPL